MRTILNFLAADRRPSLVLLICAFSAIACARAVLGDGWEAYYHIMHYEEDRSAGVQSSSDWRFCSNKRRACAWISG